MTEFPFDLTQFDSGEFYQFTKEIKIPVYGSPTVEELLFVSRVQNANQIDGLVSFAQFFLKARCGIELSEAQLAKLPIKKLKELMDFFNREAEGLNQSEEVDSKNAPIGLQSIGNSGSITPTSLDSVESNSGVAL
ncbi:MAG: hypothetical protein SFT94_02200 [Pseudanabaenaceae cyanobacterium bins.68]|nr:hypothetical protein [Pseudanabaenaceae cyanobacterium bins.68]